MANYTRLEYGSKGDDVKKLQETLNSKGYSLDVDGSYGPKTQAAVKDYQSKNNLSVDGVTGNQTWTSLLGSNTSAAQTPTSTNAATGKVSTPSYNQSALVQAAQNKLNNIESNAPAAYQSENDAQLQQLLNQVLNPQAFSYNPNKDSAYLQYRDQYTAAGKKAMEDSMGKAVALSGGFNNSYAQQVGQSTYNDYMKELSGKIPELEQIAYERYRNEMADKQAAYETLKKVEDTEYARYMDALNQYYAERDYAAGRRDSLSSEDFNQYLSEIQNEQWDKQYNYQLDRDKIEDERYDAETIYNQHRDSVADNQWNQNYELTKRQVDAQLESQNASTNDVIQEYVGETHSSNLKTEYLNKAKSLYTGGNYDMNGQYVGQKSARPNTNALFNYVEQLLASGLSDEDAAYIIKQVTGHEPNYYERYR